MVKLFFPDIQKSKYSQDRHDGELLDTATPAFNFPFTAQGSVTNVASQRTPSVFRSKEILSSGTLARTISACASSNSLNVLNNAQPLPIEHLNYRQDYVNISIESEEEKMMHSFMTKTENIKGTINAAALEDVNNLAVLLDRLL